MSRDAWPGGRGSRVPGRTRASSGVVLRTTSAGQLDPAFGTAGVATTSPWQNEVLVVDASGRAYACSSRSDGGTEAGVLRLDGGGGLDPTFAESGAFGWRPGFTHGTLCRAMVLSGGSPVFAADQRRWMEDLSVVREFVLVRLR